LPKTLADLGSLVDRSGWKDLTAVRKGKVFAVDGHHYFNRPGPRLVESAELIAQLLGTSSIRAFEMGRDWMVIGGD
jgi:iron complex transport system substrate-binding protein